MGKPMVESEIFKDKDGYLCAVRKDMYSEAEAVDIAKKRLCNEEVRLTEQYSYMYHGFGKGDDDEYANTWWLTDDVKKNSIPVYVFREWKD